MNTAMTMNKLYAFAIALGSLLTVANTTVQAQNCSGGFGATAYTPIQTNLTATPGSWTAFPPITPWGNQAPNTAAGAGNINCGFSGTLTVPACASNYASIWLCASNVYTFSLCSGTPWDSYLALTDASGNALTPSPIVDNDGCGTPGGLSVLNYTPTISGTFRIRIRTNQTMGAGTTNGSTSVTVASTTGMIAGSPVIGPGIPLGATITSITNATTFVISVAATATQAFPSATLQFPCMVAAANCGTLTITVTPIPAPPVNDTPCLAFSLNPVTSSCTPLASTAIFATQSNPPSAPPIGCGASFSGFDVWYTATVPATGNISIQVDHQSALDMAMSAYTLSGACPGGTWTLLGCNADLSNPTLLAPFLSFSGLAPGATVYIRVWPQGGNANNGTFEICAYEPVPPANDNPCAAATLTVASPCTATNFTTESATSLSAAMTASPATPTCGTPLAGGDVWFQFVAPGTGSVTISTFPGSIANMAMALYSLTAGTPCAGTLTQIGCDDNSGVGGTMPRLAPGGLTPGVTYYIRMWSQTSAFGTFSICVFPNTPPANDEPCGAIPLPVNAGCLFTGGTTEYATTTLVSNPPNWNTVPAPSCGGAANSDVWYTAVVPSNGIIQLDSDDGSLLNAAMAVYTVTSGSCGSNLVLATAGCANTGSTNAPGTMPGLTVSGLTPGATVYIRLWRETVATNGTFQICARSTVSPPGACDYILRMTDTGGDGWNGSFVTITINGVPTNYTIIGSTGNIVFSANVGDLVIVSYTAVGGFQNQISYQLTTPVGGILFASGSPPASGPVFPFTVDAACNVPPAPVSDCTGALTVCNNQAITGSPVPGFGTQELNASNRGCLSGNEIRGVWVRFTAQSAGTIAFTLTVAAGTDYDFAVWGPYGGAPTCPPAGAPLRCSWSGATGNTGLNYTSSDLTEGAGGDKFVRWIDALAGQSFMLYVDNWSNNGVTFTLNWNLVPTNILDCTLPLELITFEAVPKPRQVDLNWVTGSEENTAYFQVERAAGGEFTPLGRVQAAGFSQGLTEYSFIDPMPVKGVNYYRLDQVDADGARKYSNTVSATYRWSSVDLAVYPNPAGESLFASFEMPGEGSVRWRIMDMSGRIVIEGPATVAMGMNQVEVPLTHVEAGSYLLEVLDAAGVPMSNARFVRQ